MNLQVLDKIKKLLALSTSSNQHEAELALSHAKRLALIHEIDLVKLGNEKVEESIIDKSRELPIPKNEQIYHNVAQILTDFFRVKVINTQHGVKRVTTLVGKKTDLEIAQYVYVFLCKKFMELFRLYLDAIARDDIERSVCRELYSESFYKGLYEGLYDKLYKEQKEILDNETQETQKSFAIVLVSNEEKIMKKLKELFPILTTRESTQYNAHSRKVYDNAYSQGQQLNINRALETKEQSVKGRLL